LKQDKTEAVMAVNGRLEFIEKEMYASKTVSKLIASTTTDDIPANVSKRKSRKPKRRPIKNGQRYILELEYFSHEYTRLHDYPDYPIPNQHPATSRCRVRFCMNTRIDNAISKSFINRYPRTLYGRGGKERAVLGVA